MLENVLDSEYAWAFRSGEVAERAMLVYELPESAIVPFMEAVEAQYEGVKAFSLPSIGDGRDGKAARRHIELGVKGPAGSIDAAFDILVAGVRQLGAEFERT
jgi:molybdopterin-biosynthesis enzyme MoeA-like protein